MPLSHVPEILGCAVIELARMVAALPEARHTFTEVTAAATRRAL